MNYQFYAISRTREACNRRRSRTSDFQLAHLNMANAHYAVYEDAAKYTYAHQLFIQGHANQMERTNSGINKSLQSIAENLKPKKSFLIRIFEKITNK